MSAQPARRPGGLVASAIAAAEAWLLEPADAAEEAAHPPLLETRPVVAVFGLAPACGASVVARALAAELAARDVDGAAAVAASVRAAGVPLASRQATWLARTLGALPGARARATGRLSLVDCPDQLALADAARYLAPLVLDAGHAAVGGAPASIADRIVLVGSPQLEPALAAVAAACVARVGPQPLIVLNRAREAHERWTDRAALELPESRMGAQLAVSGRQPLGELGRAVAELADLCSAPR